jgi:hypothetical protein
MDDLENFWENMLSREPKLIRLAWNTLSAEEQQSVYEHLHDMATGEGWMDAQRESAQAALKVLQDFVGR